MIGPVIICGTRDAVLRMMLGQANGWTGAAEQRERAEGGGWGELP